MIPAIYRIRIQVIDHALDKPVKSNGLRFRLSKNCSPTSRISGVFGGGY
jgi:hypothetical protein